MSDPSFLNLVVALAKCDARTYRKFREDESSVRPLVAERIREAELKARALLKQSQPPPRAA